MIKKFSSISTIFLCYFEIFLISIQNSFQLVDQLWCIIFCCVYWRRYAPISGFNSCELFFIMLDLFFENKASLFQICIFCQKGFYFLLHFSYCFLIEYLLFLANAIQTKKLIRLVSELTLKLIHHNLVLSNLLA